MAIYTVGMLIAKTRKERRYSQEFLSFGICSTSSLSRIENGRQMPGRKKLEALLQRLGISDSVYNIFVSTEEMELYQLVQELDLQWENPDYTKLEQLIASLEKRICKKHFLERQCLLFAKARLLKKQGGHRREILKLLHKALSVTMGKLDVEGSLKNHLLTFDEIMILNSIALELYAAGESEKGLRLLYQLKYYMDEHIMDEKEKAEKYPILLNHISRCVGNDWKKFREAYRISDEGIRFCVQHNKLAVLPHLIYNKACAACELGYEEEAKRLLHQAVTLFTICEKWDMAGKIQEEFLTKYHMKIESGI